ncbi:hypothetical protein LTR70_009459 [Exophiala xenobiotica]|uniref:DUF2293 domain-containing protein n=1 Tax=Lithohypha guttulata TaxID=1690604 RepID=A0ABR0JXM7_9EURO|nr:hypothetical protein LTR24_009228 [Lithohypha guttulata]KAK5310467.1 hypothetical protein LTR70_009459 [Exophiala xenobiotica]
MSVSSLSVSVLPREPIISASNSSKLNLPQGYIFVRKGNVYITKHSRKSTHEAGQKVFIVQSATKAQLGIAVPSSIYRQIQKLDKETSATRATAVAKKDAVVKDAFENELQRLFPHAPKDNVDLVLKHTLKKRSGRVGRTTKLELGKVVTLAVRAHIRHKLTDYDALLGRGVDREQARKEVQSAIDQIARDWSGKVKASTGRVEKSTVLKRTGRVLTVKTSTARTEKSTVLKKTVARLTVEQRILALEILRREYLRRRRQTTVPKAARSRKSEKLALSAAGRCHMYVTSTIANPNPNPNPQEQQPRRKSLRIDDQTFQAAMSRLDDCDLIELN